MDKGEKDIACVSNATLPDLVQTDSSEIRGVSFQTDCWFLRTSARTVIDSNQAGSFVSC